MKTAWLFPGQGSQYVGMSQVWLERFPIVEDYFKKADEVLGFSLSELVKDGSDDELRLTFNAQPAILTLSVALTEVLRNQGFPEPDFVAGHSLGEFSALVAKGVLSFEDAVSIVHERGKAMQEAMPPGSGGMVALMGATPDKINSLLKDSRINGVLEIANDNGAGQVILSGDKASIESAKEFFKEYEIKKLIDLPVSAPFHSSLMKPAAERLKAALSGKLSDKSNDNIKLLHNVTVSELAPGDIEAVLVEQLTSRVRWRETMDVLAKEELDFVLEVGPKNVLSGLWLRHLRLKNMKALEKLTELSLEEIGA